MIELIVGGVPVCRPLERTVADGLVIIGDAARVADPITGGGIYNAMYTGRLAGQVAADAIAAGDVSTSALMAYDHGWRGEKLGRSLDRNYRIKEIFVTLSDEKLNRIVRAFSRMDLSKFSVHGIVREVVKHDPGLLLEIRSLKDLL